MILFLVFVIVFCFTLLGFKLASYYKNRKNFYYDLDLFVSSLNLDIYFTQSKLIDVLKTNAKNVASNELKQLCCNVQNKLSSFEKIDDSIFKDISILRKQEKDVLLSFFASLGKRNVYAQTNEIKTYVLKFKEIYEYANNECKKYYSLCIKLGVIVGFLICLLII